MVYEKKIEGKYVYLRSVTVEDAEFTLKLRQDPRVEKCLPRLNISLERQREWIIRQRMKQGDYFFISCDKKGNCIGTIGLYDIEGGKSDSGRLALLGDAFQNVETAILLYTFAFDILKLNEITGYVYADNKRALRFNERLGCLIQSPVYDESKRRYVCHVLITRDSFHNAEQKLQKILYS